MGDPVGFIGLGRMGTPMARRLMAAGHGLVVHDTNMAALEVLAAEGATLASSPADMAARVETVFLSLPTPAIVDRVTLGEAGLIRGGTLRRVVDLSTTGSRAAAAIAGALVPGGIDYVDAPVSGGIAGAAKGTLTLMTSGPRPAFEAVEAMLAQFGRVFFVGEKSGLGQSMKVINNLLAATALAITAEGVVAGAKAGLDPAQMIDILNLSSGRNSATEDKFPRAILPRTFDFGFPTSLSHKDVRMCLEEADALGVPMFVGSAVREILAATSSLFGPESDFTSIIRTLELWGGIELPAYGDAG